MEKEKHLSVEEMSEEEYRAYIRRRRRIAAARKKRKQRKRMIRLGCFITAVACLGTIFVLFAAFRNSNLWNRINNAEIFFARGESSQSKKTAYFSESQSKEFEKLRLYKQENAGRYIAYSEKNPQLTDEDVVWRVNSMLDYEMYNHDVRVFGYDDLYIIVNKYYKVDEDYCPPDLVTLDGVQVRESTKTAFEAMRKEAQKNALSLRVVSGYRSVSYQRDLYNRYLASDSQKNVDRYSARPGYSEHHTGYAIDLFGSTDGLRNFENTPEYSWVKENCHKYGFIIRYTKENEAVTGYESEPWHLRYIGVEAATDMHNKNIGSFEEYKAKYLG